MVEVRIWAASPVDGVEPPLSRRVDFVPATSQLITFDWQSTSVAHFQPGREVATMAGDTFIGECLHLPCAQSHS